MRKGIFNVKKLTKKQEEIQTIIEQLKKNTEVLDALAETLNIKIFHIGYSLDEDYAVTAMCDIVSLDGKGISNNIAVKFSLYDETDSLIGTSSTYLWAEKFKGFDTLEFYFNDDNIGLYVQKARVFATYD